MSNILGFIASNKAHIIWQTDDDCHVAWVEVYRFGCVPDDVWVECDAGASSVDWCGGDPRLTPEGVYAFWEEIGFSSPSVRRLAWRALSQIQECDWARSMLAAVEADDE